MIASFVASYVLLLVIAGWQSLIHGEFRCLDFNGGGYEECISSYPALSFIFHPLFVSVAVLFLSPLVAVVPVILIFSIGYFIEKRKTKD
ncbi:MAG: hypothetical protein AAB579_02285 [Patescibacteria group bacterium]